MFTLQSFVVVVKKKKMTIEKAEWKQNTVILPSPPLLKNKRSERRTSYLNLAFWKH